MKRSGIATLLILLLTLTLTLPAYAEEGGVCGDDLQWSFSGGTLTITGSGEMTDFRRARCHRGMICGSRSPLCHCPVG